MFPGQTSEARLSHSIIWGSVKDQPTSRHKELTDCKYILVKLACFVAANVVIMLPHPPKKVKSDFDMCVSSPPSSLFNTVNKINEKPSIKLWLVWSRDVLLIPSSCTSAPPDGHLQYNIRINFS